MSEQSGVSRRQLHNYQSQLVDAGYLLVVNRRTPSGAKDTNFYDFSPLFAHLEQLLERDCAAGPANPLTSHTHVNPSSHTHENAPSHPHGNPGSHEKNHIEEPLDQESEPFENSNLRNVPTKETSPFKTERSSEPVSDIEGRGAQAPSRSRARPETLAEDYQQIQDCIIDRAREFYDTASIKSSTTRAYRMYQRSGMSVEQFIEHVFQARAITQERTASITKMTEGSDYEAERKTKMAYFFAVLEDHLGLAADRPARGEADESV
jgi:hypothetical protein